MRASTIDKLILPKFLRRPLTPEAKERNHKVALSVTRPHTAWAKPRDPAVVKEEQRVAAMARINTYVQNRAAPVEVSYHPKGSASAALLRRFGNVDEFEEWYKPAVHHCTCVAADDSVTILFSSLPDWAVKRETGQAQPKVAKATSERAAKVPAEPKAPGKPSLSKMLGLLRYVDSRHVQQMADAGWTFKDNSFSKGKVTVTIDPPPAGKRWSSSWTVKGQAGRGIAALLKALEG